MDLVISSIGMVTSVGHDATCACASIRAGLARAGPVPDYMVLEDDTHETVPLSGHPISGITDGFAAPARWIQMARLAFNDVCQFGDLPGVEDHNFWSTTLIAFVTPILNDMRFLFTPNCQPDAIQESYVKILLKSIGLQIPPEHIVMFTQGRTEPFRAINSAYNLMKTKRTSRVLIVAVDSYLDGMSLHWLGQQGRLKSGDNPVGLMPGESAVAIMLEPSQAVGHRGGKALAKIESCAIGSESNNIQSQETNNGRALASVMVKCLSQAKIKRPFSGDLYVDLNGEIWRAHEFGSAQTQIPKNLLSTSIEQLPAGSIGDVGAAFGALNLSLAARALERGYATEDAVLAISSSDEGYVGAAVLRRNQ